MCLSPEVDAAMGIVIGAIAIDAIRHNRGSSHVALAALPAVLAAHQLIEALVWLGVDGRVAPSIGKAAIYAYLLIAFGLPLLVPPAVASIEPDPDRRKLMARLGAVGALVALVLLAGVVTGPVSAVDEGNRIAYHARLFHGVALTGVYVVATLGCFLASSHRYVVIFGVLNVVAVLVLAWVTITGFVSLWCAWAALTSLIIAVHLRSTSIPTPHPRGA